MRIDFVITTKKEKPKRNYNIVVKSQSDLCLDRTPPQTAILVYDDNEDLPTKSYNLETVYDRPVRKLFYIALSCIIYPCLRTSSTYSICFYFSTLVMSTLDVNRLMELTMDGFSITALLICDHWIR